MFCPNCGKGIDENANFCKDCGKPLADTGAIAEEVDDVLRSTTQPTQRRSEGGGQVDGLDYAELELQRQINEQQERVRHIRSQIAQERRIRNSQREITRLEEEELREQERLERLRLTWDDETWDSEYGRRDLQRQRSSKSKVVAGVLALLLGGLGIHKFYLGYISQGFILLAAWLISAATAPFGVGIVGLLVVWVIVWIEGFIYFTKTDEYFNDTYVVKKRAWF